MIVYTLTPAAKSFELGSYEAWFVTPSGAVLYINREGETVRSVFRTTALEAAVRQGLMLRTDVRHMYSLDTGGE